MAYTKQEVEKAISVLNKPSCHIKHVYKTENGKCLIKTFARNHKHEYPLKDFGSMGEH